MKLFTHIDLDGYGCAILAKLAFGENADIEYCNYDNINEKVEEFLKSGAKDDCYITDISVSDKLAQEIENKDEFYLLLDHHPTALGLIKYDWCTVEIYNLNGIKTSGTEMYYYWLVDNGYLEQQPVLDDFVEIVRNYDTWRWASLGEEGLICKKVNDLFHLYGRDRFIDWCISQIKDEVFPRFYAADSLVLELEQRRIDNYVEEKDKKLFTVPLCSKVCGVVFAEKYFSELGNRLCKIHPEIDFVAMIDMDGTISYRTIKDDIDLGKDVAALFGGGGHPKAAGSRFSEEIKLKLVGEIFN